METELMQLDERMKYYEHTFDNTIQPYQPYLLRLDGRSFSKYTTGLKKPFDDMFQLAMIKTMNDMVHEFNAMTGYTHSDEITLIFNKTCSKEEYDSKLHKSTRIFNGRVMKITTITSGYCSVRFNYHMNDLLKLKKAEYNSIIINKIESFNAGFDCRAIIFPIDKEQEMVNMLLWRSVHDCHRNAVSTYGRQYMSHNELHNKNSDEIIVILKNKYNLDWQINVPIYHKHGVYAKRELYTISIDIPQKGNQMVIRQRIVNKCFIIKYCDKIYDLLLAKNWPQDSEFINENITFEMLGHDNHKLFIL